MNGKYKTGAFVFTRSRGLEPRTPEEIQPIAAKHGINPTVIPEYSGDRAAIGRAIQRTDTKIQKETYLLRPIRRNSKEVTYGIVREDNLGNDHLDHAHEETLTWKAEPDPSIIEGNHTIANRVRLLYNDLKGKIVSEDWTAAVTAELDRLGAVPFREDGRVYWAPPQSLNDLKRLRDFLAEVGVALVIAEVESESASVVTEVVAENVDEQLHRLEQEVADFDSKQKPSMFARRLEEFQKLRQKALLYQSALGIGAERTEKVLTELEGKVGAMLDIRQGMTVHKDGSVSKKGEKAPAQRRNVVDGAGDVGCKDAESTNAENVDVPVRSSKTHETRLTFAGCEYTHAETKNGIYTFTSPDDRAVSVVKSLEGMGLAGKWQKAGKAEVCIKNNGPKKAPTSVLLKIPTGTNLSEAAKPLSSLGIQLS